MAGDEDVLIDDETTVHFDEDGKVTEQVADPPEPPKKTAPQPRQRQSASDDAAAALTKALEAAELAKKAAEDTALAERRRADESARLAAQRETEVKGYQDRAESAEVAAINARIDGAKRDLEAGKAAMQTAWDAGDGKAVGDAQERVARAASMLDRLDERKTEYEARAAQEPPPVAQQPQQQGSAFEQYVGRFAPVAQAWLRSHPECVPSFAGGDPTANAKMMLGHEMAKKQYQEGTPDYFRVIEEHTGHRTPVSAAAVKQYQEGTPDYFRVIEEHTGHRTPVSAAAVTVQAGEPPTPAAPARRQAQPSAPVSREPPSPSGRQPGRTSVTLNPAQQEVARFTYPHLEPKEAYARYAKGYLEAEADGKLGRTSH